MRRYCPTCANRFTNEVAFCPHDGAATMELSEEVPEGDPLLGQVVDGRYRIEKQIGEGGMGVVYVATHTALGKKLALKVLRGDMAKDPDTVQRFMQEAQAATSIGHENIIDINDFGRLPDGAVYFVMEYLAGEALTDLISRGGSLPMSDVLRIVRQIASALEAAHDRGIVHRDMKPDNVLLIERGGDPRFVKVLDFGIAKVGGAASKLTKTGMVFGTPHYMSPEQAAGQSVDKRTDVYALGVIMYEMFTGKVPFDADTFMGILSKHLFEPPVPPSHATTVRLGAMEDVILRALQKKPEERYSSMGDLIADLDAVSVGGTVSVGGGASGSASDIAPPGLADSLEPRSRTEMQLERSLQSGGRSKLMMMAAAIGALLLVGAGVAGAVYGLGSEGTPDAGGDGTTEVAQPPPPLVPEPPDEQPGDLPQGADVPVDPPPVEPAVPPADQRVVEIRSEPAGAQVLASGATVGNTPVRIPMPDVGGEREVELRLRGHEAESVRVTSESPEVIEVTLRRSARRVRVQRGPRNRAAGMMGSGPTMVTRMRVSEVVDPWAQ